MIVKYAPTKFFFLTVELLVSLARGGNRETKATLWLSKYVPERETEMEIKTETERDREEKR